MCPGLEELAEPELTGDRPEQLARGEVDGLRARDRLAAGVVVDARNAVPGVVRRVAGDRVVVEDAEYFGHGLLLLSLLVLPRLPTRPRPRA